MCSRLYLTEQLVETGPHIIGLIGFLKIYSQTFVKDFFFME